MGSDRLEGPGIALAAAVLTRSLKGGNLLLERLGVPSTTRRRIQRATELLRKKQYEGERHLLAPQCLEVPACAMQ